MSQIYSKTLVFHFTVVTINPETSRKFTEKVFSPKLLGVRDLKLQMRKLGGLTVQDAL